MAPSLRLGDFVARVAAQQGLELNPSHPPFHGQDSPVLRPNRAPNHVLLYPGSFNPPHRGHKALLEHVLRHAADDVSFVAAIVIPTDDERLAAKNIEDERPFLLTKSKRASLWREAGLPDHRVWVFEESNNSWKSFRAQLQKSLARQRIDLNFVLLVGPDCITARGPSDPKSWDCGEAITSDISRPVDFLYPHSLRQLPGCSEWEPCSLPGDAQATNAAAGRSGVDEVPTLVFATSWKCETLRKPLRRYRFVPSQLPEPERPEVPSSTNIRRLIATCPERQLVKELERLVLGPSLLLRFAREGGPYSVPATRNRLDHETRKAKADERAVW